MKDSMENIKAIGFDFFNTLIFIEHGALNEAFGRLTASLEESAILPEIESFRRTYRETARRLVTETRAEGKETHNRFWISATLASLGCPVEPDDARISRAVEAYFSTFFDFCRPIPGTVEMLERLARMYRLGLLSNFTHAPAAKGLLEQMGMASFFDTVLISGEIGFRKPHPLVFEMLVKNLGYEKDRILYVGDSFDPDILGAEQCGLRPVWMTYVQDHHLPVVPSFDPAKDQAPGPEVPRVTDWDELLSLLGMV
jgi:putative hydrolase of the HAD superfamily